MEIHERIREFRKNDLHMSQEDLGKLLGVSRSVISNIELNALSRPDQKEPLYRLLCKEFHLNKDWLMSGKEPKYSYEFEEDEYTRVVAEIDKGDEKAKQAILDYWKLTKEDKELFMNFIHRFIAK